MKRYLPWMSLLILFSLVACSAGGVGKQPIPPATTATLSPDQVQTQINLLLTQMPTSTGAPAEAVSPTVALPTVAVEYPAPGVVTATPTQPAPAEPTATLEPTAVPPTDTPQPAATAVPANTATSDPNVGGGIPTVAITPVSPAATAVPAGPTFTPAPGDPRQTLGSPTSTDPMDNATAWVWPTGSDKYTVGTFSGGSQRIVALTGTDGWRMANPAGREFANLYLEATIRTTTCSGSDHYGLIFRVPVLHEPEQGYLFGLTCDGRYSIRRWNALVGQKGEMKWLVNWTASNAIAAGANQTNRLGVMMVGSRILVYANGKLLTEVQDNTYSYGYFGVFVGSDVTDSLTIHVDEMSYWENPRIP